MTEDEPSSIQLVETAQPGAREIELKLRVPPEHLEHLAACPVLADRALGPPHRRQLVGTYFDTADRRLARRGLALRVRRIGRRRIQTLKAAHDATGAIADRPEWEAPIGGETPDLSAFADPAAREAVGLVLPGELAPVFETRIDRTELTVGWPDRERPEAVVAVAIDRGVIRANGKEEPVSELELELARGPERALAALTEALRGVAPLAVETRDKAARGWALAEGLVPPPRKAGKLELDPELTVAEAFRRIGRACLGHWLANEPAAADGRDVEGVHQLRVALRRLRSAFSLFRAVLPEAERARLVAELRWLLGELGPARDRDVLAHDLLPPLRGSGVLEAELAALEEALARGRPGLYERLRAALASRRYADLVLDLAIWLELERFREQASPEARAILEGPILPFARDALERRWRKAKKRGRKFAALDAEERHALRIAIKKLRYGLDFFAALWPGTATRKFARRLAELQDRLGHLNDVRVAEDLARAVAAETRGEPAGGAVALAAGALIGWYARASDRMLREAADRFEAFAEQEPFWRETV